MLIQWRASSHRVVRRSSPSSGLDGRRRVFVRAPAVLVEFLPFFAKRRNHFRSIRATPARGGLRVRWRAAA